MTGLNVVHVVCTDAFAGVERYVLGSATCLAAAGCTVTVIGGSESSMKDRLRSVGVDWLPGSTVGSARRSLRSLGRLDVINSHMTLADLAGVLEGRRRGVPVVSTRHFASRRGSSIPSRILARWMAPRITAQIAISEYVAANIEGANSVVHTGVDSVELHGQTRDDLVLVAQRLEAEKATAVALRAWALLDEPHGWRLVIAGTGSEAARLHQLAAALGIADTVDFIGFQADLDPLYRKTSILLAPTPREGLGLSVIEAMAYALPVVASRAGGHLESAGGVADPALFEPDDARDAARQLARLMRDAHERTRYGRALQDRQRQVFNLRNQTEATLRVLAAATA